MFNLQIIYDKKVKQIAQKYKIIHKYFFQHIWCFSIWLWSYAFVSIWCIAIVSFFSASSVTIASTCRDYGSKVNYSASKRLMCLILSIFFFLLEKSTFGQDRFWFKGHNIRYIKSVIIYLKNSRTRLDRI